MSEVTLIRELVRALERARRDTKDVFQNRFLTNNCARNIRTEPIYTPCLCGTGAQIYIYLNTKYNNKEICNFRHSNSCLFTTNCTSFKKMYSLVSEIWQFKRYQFESQAARIKSYTLGSHSSNKRDHCLWWNAFNDSFERQHLSCLKISIKSPSALWKAS